jgi:hypothetical protein
VAFVLGAEVELGVSELSPVVVVAIVNQRLPLPCVVVTARVYVNMKLGTNYDISCEEIQFARNSFACFRGVQRWCDDTAACN